MRAFLRMIDGTEQYASLIVVNPWSRQREFLVGSSWIREEVVSKIVWIVK